MRAGFKITTEHGKIISTTVTLAEVLLWSKTYGHPIAEVQQQATDDQWFEMIWWAATREGKTDLSFKDFLASIENFEGVATDGPKATRKARSTGSSSASK